jgi:hypothetical protein
MMPAVGAANGTRSAAARRFLQDADPPDVDPEEIHSARARLHGALRNFHSGIAPLATTMMQAARARE